MRSEGKHVKKEKTEKRGCSIFAWILFFIALCVALVIGGFILWVLYGEEGDGKADTSAQQEVQEEKKSQTVTVDVSKKWSVPNEALPPETVAVDGYDICIEQADANGLTERETSFIADNRKLTPPYRVRIRAVLVGQEDEYASIKPDEALPVQAQPEGDTDEEAPSKPVGVKLPEGCYPEGAEMLVLPTEDVRDVGEGAETVFISLIDEPEDEDVSQRTPAEFIEKEEILYARVPLNADGVYAVSAPEDSLVIGEYDDEDDFEEADAE